MKVMKVKILKTYTRAEAPKFIMRKGQIYEMVMTNKQAKVCETYDGKLYKILSIKNHK